MNDYTATHTKKQQAYSAAKAAVEAFFDIKLLWLAPRQTHPTIDHWNRIRSLAEEAKAYREMTGDGVGARELFDGASMANVIAGTLQRQRECACVLPEQTCSVCAGKAREVYSNEFGFEG